MIRIDKITRGRFGNKILHYLAGYQLSKITKQDFSCDPWPGNIIFEDIVNKKQNLKNGKEITWEEITSEKFKNYDFNASDYILGEYCLHNV